VKGAVMAQDMYWYKDRWNGSSHVVFASSKSIAQWYVNSSRTWLKDPVFVEKRNRSADGYESFTVLAHAADTTLKRSIVEMRANGCSSDYLAKLEHMANRIQKTYLETITE
jgi:hypothetical protein